jgi:hypothetical protein
MFQLDRFTKSKDIDKQLNKNIFLNYRDTEQNL